MNPPRQRRCAAFSPLGVKKHLGRPGVFLNLPEQLALFRLPPAATPPKTRHLQIGARIVAYELLTGRRRLSLTIDERGLRIGAPRALPLVEIEAFARQHGDWILEKLAAHAARRALHNIPVRDGALVPLLGSQACLRVVAGANRVAWDGDVLVLAARSDADLATLARRGLQRRALALFVERVALLAAQMGRAPPPVALSSARTRWGSCSRVSGIRLNWRLIHLPLALVDYVVAHEMAHLIEMNHSRRFWAEVERLCPAWRDLRRELKNRAAAMPLI